MNKITEKEVFNKRVQAFGEQFYEKDPQKVQLQDTSLTGGGDTEPRTPHRDSRGRKGKVNTHIH